MSRKVYISAGVLTLLFILIIFGLLRINNGDSNVESTSSDNTSNSTNQHSKKQLKQAENRSDAQSKLDDKIQTYIKHTNAPKSQKEYDEAILMRSPNTQSELERNVKDLVNDKSRSVKDIYTYIDYDNKNELSGSYEYTLISKKDGKSISENKDGDFTIKTNKEGYFYIDQFD